MRPAIRKRPMVTSSNDDVGPAMTPRRFTQKSPPVIIFHQEPVRVATSPYYSEVKGWEFIEQVEDLCPAAREQGLKAITMLVLVMAAATGRM